MARRRFFVDSIARGEAELRGDDAAHLARVLRATPGQQFEISDSRNLYLAEIVSVERAAVHFRILDTLDPGPQPVRVLLFAALIKFDRFEWMIEKTTELGVDTVIPINAERSERGLAEAAAKRAARWRKIAHESAQQSRRLRAPSIEAPRSLAAALAEPATHRFWLEETPGAPRLLDSLPQTRDASDTLSVFLGPEGGWTEAERAQASGCRSVSLSPTILRAETAAAAALAILTNAWPPTLSVRL